MSDFRTFSAFAVLAVLAAGIAQAEPVTYENGRFGTSATFPAEIFTDQQPEPENGDGLRWLSKDGASIAIFGQYKDIDDTPKTLEAFGKTLPGRTVTYSKTGKNWLVQSGFDDGQIFYERQVIGPSDIIHAVVITYPPALKAKYDSLVGPIAQSLKGP